MVAPIPAPALNIPSGSAAKVSIIDTTAIVSTAPTAPFMNPGIAGIETFSAPVFSFLIEHESGRKVLFDFGIRKDFDNLPPVISEMVEPWGAKVEKNVSEILVENGVALEDIEALIWR